MNTSKKILSGVLASSLLFGAIAPINSNVKAAENKETNVEIVSNETLELLELQYQLQKYNITYEDIALGIQAGLPKQRIVVPETSGSQIVTYGVKTEAAKIAAQQMIKNIKRIGSIAWDRTMREYVNKLPVTDSAKSVLKKYLAYQVVVSSLNVVIDFSGTIEDGISEQIQKIGCPAWLADMVARALVMLLL